MDSISLLVGCCVLLMILGLLHQPKKWRPTPEEIMRRVRGGDEPQIKLQSIGGVTPDRAAWHQEANRHLRDD